MMKKMKGIIPLIVTGLVFSLGACNNNKDEGSSKKPNASSVSSLPKIKIIILVVKIGIYYYLNLQKYIKAILKNLLKYVR